MTPLQQLAAAIEAGKVDQFRNLDSEFGKGNGIHAKRAYNGSLDAAKALHEALLPDWVLYRMNWWPKEPNPASVEIWGTQRGSHSFKDGRCEAVSVTPARAWLLAIVRALIAKETKE